MLRLLILFCLILSGCSTTDLKGSGANEVTTPNFSISCFKRPECIRLADKMCGENKYDIKNEIVTNPQASKQLAGGKDDLPFLLSDRKFRLSVNCHEPVPLKIDGLRAFAVKK